MYSEAFLQASDRYQAALARLGGFTAQLEAADRQSELPGIDHLDYLLWLGFEANAAQEHVEQCFLVVRATPPRAATPPATVIPPVVSPPDIVAEIADLAAWAAHLIEQDGPSDYNEDAWEELHDAIHELDARCGPGLAVGRFLDFVYGDGSPCLYIIDAIDRAGGRVHTTMDRGRGRLPGRRGGRCRLVPAVGRRSALPEARSRSGEGATMSHQNGDHAGEIAALTERAQRAEAALAELEADVAGILDAAMRAQATREIEPLLDMIVTFSTPGKALIAERDGWKQRAEQAEADAGALREWAEAVVSTWTDYDNPTPMDGAIRHLGNALGKDGQTLLTEYYACKARAEQAEDQIRTAVAILTGAGPSLLEAVGQVEHVQRELIKTQRARESELQEMVAAAHVDLMLLQDAAGYALGLLRQLNVRGGLGLDVHEAIDRRIARLEAITESKTGVVLLAELAAGRGLAAALVLFMVETKLCPACKATLRGFGREWPHGEGCAFVAYQKATKLSVPLEPPSSAAGEARP